MTDLDLPLLVATLALCVLGGLTLDSVTAHTLAWSSEVIRQLISMGVGFGLMVGLSRVSPGRLRWLAGPLYLLGVAGLALVRVPGIGQLSHGARRWISLGPLGSLQPAEPAKLALLLVLATLLTSSERRTPRPWNVVAALILVGLPAGLIITQPDLGTTLVVIGTTVIMLFVAGTSPVLLAALATAALAVAPFLMHGYQKVRWLSFLNPSADPMGTGYNWLQAQTAVGSGRLWGTGLFAGPMSQHGFVPENWTDFIFSAMGEETGFVGCVGCLALYAIMLGLLVRTAWAARTRFDMLLVTGVLSLLTLHVLVNVAMVLGLIPATGLPLPFASYGGSAVLTQMAALGLAMGVYRRGQEAATDVWGLTSGDLGQA